MLWRAWGINCRATRSNWGLFLTPTVISAFCPLAGVKILLNAKDRNYQNQFGILLRIGNLTRGLRWGNRRAE